MFDVFWPLSFSYLLYTKVACVVDCHRVMVQRRLLLVPGMDKRTLSTCQKTSCASISERTSLHFGLVS